MRCPAAGAEEQARGLSRNTQKHSWSGLSSSQWGGCVPKPCHQVNNDTAALHCSRKAHNRVNAPCRNGVWSVVVSRQSFTTRACSAAMAAIACNRTRISSVPTDATADFPSAVSASTRTPALPGTRSSPTNRYSTIATTEDCVVRCPLQYGPVSSYRAWALYR